jgi:hypothetical protein
MELKLAKQLLILHLLALGSRVKYDRLFDSPIAEKYCSDSLKF